MAWEEAYVPDQFHNAIFEEWSPFRKSGLLDAPLSNGNKVLVSLGFYLDIFNPAHAYYLNDALPVKAGSAAETSLLGGEAAMWTELEDRWSIESRIWPRAGVVAERLWSPAGEENVAGMYRRLFRLSAVLDREGVYNLADYSVRVKRLAGGLPVEPVKTLLDVLAPVKGYKRMMMEVFRQVAGSDPDAPLDRVADIVLVDSVVKYEFREALAQWLKTHDAASAKTMRTWLERWAKNGAEFKPYAAQSNKLAEVAGHATQLAAVAEAGLKALDQMEKGKALSAAQVAEADALVKAAETGDGETEIVVLPELGALFQRRLEAEPRSYPLF